MTIRKTEYVIPLVICGRKNGKLVALAEEYATQIAKLPADIRERECALIELGAESARRFDAGHDPAGSRVQRVLSDLRKIGERWERLTVPTLAEATEQQQRSPIDDLREKREARQAHSRG